MPQARFFSCDPNHPDYYAIQNLADYLGYFLRNSFKPFTQIIQTAQALEVEKPQEPKFYDQKNENDYKKMLMQCPAGRMSVLTDGEPPNAFSMHPASSRWSTENAAKREDRDPAFSCVLIDNTENGRPIWDKRAICTYLASKYGRDRMLYSPVPDLRTQVDSVLFYDKELSILYDQKGSSLLQSDVHYILENLDIFIEDGSHIAEKHRTVADFCIFPTITALVEAGLDISRYSKLTNWYRTQVERKEHEELEMKNVKFTLDSSVLQDTGRLQMRTQQTPYPLTQKQITTRKPNLSSPSTRRQHRTSPSRRQPIHGLPSSSPNLPSLTPGVSSTPIPKGFNQGFASGDQKFPNLGISSLNQSAMSSDTKAQKTQKTIGKKKAGPSQQPGSGPRLTHLKVHSDIMRRSNMASSQMSEADYRSFPEEFKKPLHYEQCSGRQQRKCKQAVSWFRKRNMLQNTKKDDDGLRDDCQ